MIIYKNSRGYETRDDKPNANWTDDDVYVVDDTSELALKIKTHAPYFDFVLDGDILIDIIPTEKPITDEEILNALQPTDEETAKAERQLEILDLLIELGVI